MEAKIQATRVDLTSPTVHPTLEQCRGKQVQAHPGPERARALCASAVQVLRALLLLGRAARDARVRVPHRAMPTPIPSAAQQIPDRFRTDGTAPEPALRCRGWAEEGERARASARAKASGVLVLVVCGAALLLGAPAPAPVVRSGQNCCCLEEAGARVRRGAALLGTRKATEARKSSLELAEARGSSRELAKDRGSSRRRMGAWARASAVALALGTLPRAASGLQCGAAGSWDGERELVSGLSPLSPPLLASSVSSRLVSPILLSLY
jgi:hypothetical protein